MAEDLRALLNALAIITAAAVAGLLGWLWWSSDGQVADRAHDDARRLWEQREPTTYSFDYSYCSGMCGPCVVHVTVRRGVVVDATSRHACGGDGAPTIEDVFAAEARDRSDSTYGPSDVAYDPTWGFPASVSLVCAEEASDCGVGYGVTNFRTP